MSEPDLLPSGATFSTSSEGSRAPMWPCSSGAKAAREGTGFLRQSPGVPQGPSSDGELESRGGRADDTAVDVDRRACAKPREFAMALLYKIKEAKLDKAS